MILTGRAGVREVAQETKGGELGIYVYFCMSARFVCCLSMQCVWLLRKYDMTCLVCSFLFIFVFLTPGVLLTPSPNIIDSKREKREYDKAVAVTIIIFTFGYSCATLCGGLVAGLFGAVVSIFNGLFGNTIAPFVAVCLHTFNGVSCPHPGGTIIGGFYVVLMVLIWMLVEQNLNIIMLNFNITLKYQTVVIMTMYLVQIQELRLNLHAYLLCQVQYLLK